MEDTLRHPLSTVHIHEPDSVNTTEYSAVLNSATQNSVSFAWYLTFMGLHSIFFLPKIYDLPFPAPRPPKSFLTLLSMSLSDIRDISLPLLHWLENHTQ